MPNSLVLRKTPSTALLIFLLSLTCCGAAPAAGPTSLVVWLAGPNPAWLAAVDADIAVMDYSADGTDAEAFNAATIKTIHDSGKTVLAYLSIGEAESYRFYWQPEWKDQPPAFLGPENPDWPQNYKVRYWDEGWWETALRPYLDRLMDAGFDGLYLDIIDGYWFWSGEGKGGGEEETDADGAEVRRAADRMMRLVLRIDAYCRKRSGREMLLCPQNGLGILADASPKLADRYLRTIDMVGVESLLFNTHSDEDRDYRIELLRRVAKRGRPILLIEYLAPDRRAELLERIRHLPFPVVPYLAGQDAALDRPGIVLGR